MTSLSRSLAVLDLFSAERPVWQADEICESLGYARATGYRYIKDLVAAGFLQRAATGQYALGARVIELDFLIRQGDPLLKAAIPVMESVATQSGFDAVLSVLYGGPKVIDIHRVSVQKTLKLSYGRGRPRPLFRAGAPKILLSGQPRAVLVRLHAEHSQEIADSGMGHGWSEFRNYMAALRRQAFYRSSGELEPGLGAAVVPVLNAEGEIIAALALVGTARNIEQQPEATLRRQLSRAAAQISRRLAG